MRCLNLKLSICAFLLILMKCSFTCYAQELLTFDVHFCVITKNPNAHQRASLAQLKKEVEILNTFFVREDRTPIVWFRFKSASMYSDVEALDCPLVAWGDKQSDVDYAALFNECTHLQVNDPNAINFYVYDDENGITSRGRRNSNRPMIFLDWERLNHQIQSPEEHEMGHAFGLGHVCVPGATINTSTNIMASSENCSGSGGLRDIGFNSEQVQTIEHYATLIHQRLAQKPANPSIQLASKALNFHASGRFVVQWNGEIGRTYKVLRSNTLSLQDAEILQSNIPGRNPLNTFADFHNASTAFYWIRSE